MQTELAAIGRLENNEVLVSGARVYPVKTFAALRER